jgi:hypothetical protein
MHAHFQSINSDPNYVAPKPLKIPNGTRIPSLSIYTVLHQLQTLKRTSSGPDDLPYWFWKEFALEMAPIITKMFNTSLKSSSVPEIWKQANVLPVPKECLH